MKSMTHRQPFPSFSRFLLTALLVIGCNVAARAELSPDVYRDMQTKAPEELVIQVQKVKTRTTRESWGQRTHVTLTARVKQVQRSQSKLKAGRVITIRYTHDRHDEPIAGPSQVPMLSKGQTAPAFLSFVAKSKGKGTRGQSTTPAHYAPVAGGYSFEKVAEPQ